MSLISNTKPSRWKVGSCTFTLICGQCFRKMTDKMTCRLCLWSVSYGNCDSTLETTAVVTDQAVKKEQDRQLQVLINRLDECRKVQLVRE